MDQDEEERIYLNDIHLSLLLFSLHFCGGEQIQGLVHGKQVLYP